MVGQCHNHSATMRMKPSNKACHFSQAFPLTCNEFHLLRFVSAHVCKKHAICCYLTSVPVWILESPVVVSHWFALWHHTYISLSSLSCPVKIKYYLDTLVFLCQGAWIAHRLECLPASLTVWPSPKWVTESVLGSNGGWSDIDQLV